MVIVYDLRSGQLFKKWKPDHSTTGVAISVEGQTVVAATENGSVYVWDLISGNQK